MHSVLILDIWEGFIDTSFLSSWTTSQWATQFFLFCLQNILLLSVKPLSSLVSITAKTFKLSISPCLHKSTLVWTCFFHISYHLMLSHCLFKKKNLYIVYKVFYDLPSSTASTFTDISLQIRSDEISRSVVSDSLWPHESQHARPPCPSPTPGVHSDSRPSSQWCYPAISSSVVPFSSCSQSLPASESFPMSQLFAWGGQSTGISPLASVLPKKSQGWSPSEWAGWISLQSKGFLRVFSNTTVQNHQFFSAQPSSQSISHIYTWPQEKP